MEKKLFPCLLGVCLFVFLGVTAQAVAAGLGEAVDPADDLRSGTSLEYRIGYAVRERTIDALTLRTYIAPTGVVFGIAWNGLVHPDLPPLLGIYRGEYAEALKRSDRRRGSRYRQIKTVHIVVEHWGQMRNLQGRAFVPSLIPPGVTVNDIQ